MKTKIKSIKKVSNHTETIDISLNGDNLFYANGILTHNSGYQNSDVDLSSTSESFGLPATTDLFLALISTDELEDADQLLIKQLKNRYNDVNKFKRFVVGIDKSRMRLYDVEDEAQNDIIPEIKAIAKETTQQKGKESIFSDFKF